MPRPRVSRPTLWRLLSNSRKPSPPDQRPTPDSVSAAMMRRGGELREQHAEAASVQTNLVAAVEQLKEALAAGQAADAAAHPAPAYTAPAHAAQAPALGSASA